MGYARCIAILSGHCGSVFRRDLRLGIQCCFRNDLRLVVGMLSTTGCETHLMCGHGFGYAEIRSQHVETEQGFPDRLKTRRSLSVITLLLCLLHGPVPLMFTWIGFLAVIVPT